MSDIDLAVANAQCCDALTTSEGQRRPGTKSCRAGADLRRFSGGASNLATVVPTVISLAPSAAASGI